MSTIELSDGSSSVCVLQSDDSSSKNALLAVPKKGRLYDSCIKLLKGAGLDHDRPNRLDVAKCFSLPVTLVFLPAADIATYVAEGDVDAGITGLDVVHESNSEIVEILNLGIGKCKLCLQAPIAWKITSPEQLCGKRIVTSFPSLAKAYFDKMDQPDNPTKIKYVSGSVEAACGLGLADGIVDLVETGTTMRAAGLEVVSEVLVSEAYLITSKHSKHPELVELIRKRIIGYLTACSYMMISYNISRVNLSLAISITPGKKAPTISPLEGSIYGDCVAVSALVQTKDSSSIMDSLEANGATDILLFSIANSRM